MGETFELSPVGKVVWEDRYALKDEKGKLIEKDISETFKRVAKAVASKEKEPEKWSEEFYRIMVQGLFCPAGRVLAHAGTHYSQLLNCFVLPFESDSLESIMNTAKNMAITQKLGGGTGFSYSGLRPAGSYIKGVNGRSCGTIGFIGMMSTISEVIEQGGCLTNDSLINTKEGLLYFRELIKETEQGWYPQDLILKTKDGDKPSERYYVNGYSDILDITTDLGINIKGTLSHKLYVFTENGFVWKEFKDIKKGDYVVSKMNQHEGQLQALYTGFDKDHHNCIVPERLPDKIDGDFAFFLGYYLGNGFSGSGENDYRNGVSIPDKSYLNDEIGKIFEQLFGSNITVTEMKKPEDQSKTYYVTNKIIKKYLKNNGLLKSKSITAFLPEKIRRSSRGVLGSFLLGLFEADGSVSHGYPQLNTSSRQLAKEVQILLLGLGIPCKFFKTKKSLNRFSKKPMFFVKVISFKGLENWNEIVNPHEKSRFLECKNFKPDLKREQNYILPHAGYWLKEALGNLLYLKEKTPEIKYQIKSLRRYIRGSRALTISAYHTLSHLVLPAVEDRLFSKVISIDFDEDFTSDMEVKESHSYVANSLISHNSRRGANMGTLEVWHPDIWEFISYKNEHNWERLREFVDVRDEEKWKYFQYENLYKWQMYNVSVAVSDEFLEALDKDEVWPFMWEGQEWELYKVIFKEAVGDVYNEKDFEVTADCDATAIWKVKRKVPYPKGTDKFEVVSRRKVKASEIWNLISYNAWADGCPGIINISEMRRMHNLEYTGTIDGTNPCGEQPLPANASCNLSSIPLVRFVNKDGTINFELLGKVVRTAVRFSDDVIDNCEFPLSEVKEKALNERRVGLGTMGVHDMLIELNLGYDTEEGRNLVEEVLQFIRNEAYQASIELAVEKGSFPAFNKKKHMKSGFIKTLPKDLRESIEEHGIRNGTLLSQAPTGSIGAFLNMSSGCEPWPFLSFTRNTRLGSYEDGCSAYIKWKEEHPNEPKPTYFKEAQEILSEDHVKMMIIFSKYVDSAVSKCVVEGTLIATDKGILPIENFSSPSRLIEGFYTPNNNYKILDEEGNTRRVLAHYYGGKKHCFKLRFDNGFELVAADTHLLKTPEGWVPFKNLKKGDTVFYRTNAIETSLPYVSVDQPEYTSYGNEKKYSFPKVLSEEFAEFIGMWLADGSINVNSISICEKNGVVKDRINYLFQSLFGEPCKEQIDKRSGVINHVLNSRVLVKYFKDHYGHNCVTKKVPFEILKSPLSVQKAFLSGLSLDGYKKRNSFVVYEGYSKQITTAVSYILSSQGIKYYIGKKSVKNGKKSKTAYSVCGYFLNRDFMAPVEPHKQNYKTASSDQWDVFVPEDVREKARKLPKGISYKSHPGHSFYIARRNLRQHLSYKKFTRQGLIEKSGFKVDTNLRRVTVTDKIDIGLKPVHDIKIEETHSYLLNGIVSHNTINLPNKATVADVKNAFELALSNGVKGLTIFRDGSKEGVLIDRGSDKKKIIKEAKKAVHDLQNMQEESIIESRMSPVKRGSKTIGSTYRVHMQSHNLYITVNRNKEGDLVEVFATVGENKNQNAHHTSGVEDSWAEGLAKMISLALRAGVDEDSVIRNLKNIPSDKPVFTSVGDNELSELIPSPPHAIARAIEEEMRCPVILGTEKKAVLKNLNCSNCGGSNTKSKSPTCYTCLDCGFETC